MAPTTETDWPRIEQEARDVASAELDRREATPLVFGDPIAWAHHRFGLTDALSSVHRVGYQMDDTPYTTCGEVIPSPAGWLVLSPALAASMPHCRFCDAEYVRLTTERAA